MGRYVFFMADEFKIETKITISLRYCKQFIKKNPSILQSCCKSVAYENKILQQ